MQNWKGFPMRCPILLYYQILNMFNMDPKSAALKNAMAKRRYNTVVFKLNIEYKRLRNFRKSYKMS